MKRIGMGPAWAGLAIALLAVTSETAPARADEPAAAPAPVPEPHVGVGYKLGNGIGFYGGDVVVNPLPHLSLDLYGAYVSQDADGGGTATGWALAPAVQGALFAGARSTPYVALGLQYVSLTLGGATASGTGFFVNLGYEWKWRSGLGIQLGGGIQHLSAIEATDGVTSVRTGGKTAPNIEFGVRYMFL
jgi:hypothetical protein